jgi:uncharacterized alpha-E superfamily protein
MLSRVAENLYWMSRYVQRAENVARLLDDAFQFELDAGLSSDEVTMGPVESILTILACRTEFEQRQAEIDQEPTSSPENRTETERATFRQRFLTPVLESATRDAVLRFLTFDRKGSHSILAMIALARENARATQEMLSAEAWSQVNRFYLYLSGHRAQRRFQSSPFRFLDSIKRECILFDGLVDSTLPRTEVYHFLQLGRYLERVDMISRILNVNLRTAPGETAESQLHTFHWASVLRSCSAYEAYLREYQDQIDPASVIRYLVLGADFPRAMRFCVMRCLESLKEIAGAGDDDGYGSEAERLLGRLESELRYLDPAEILGPRLAQFLTVVQETCNRVGQEIQQAYFLG